jgi:hypothetical protein
MLHNAVMPAKKGGITDFLGCTWFRNFLVVSATPAFRVGFVASAYGVI